MATTDPAQAVSDPSSPDYDPHNPAYDVTADSSSVYYVGPIVSSVKSGDEIRAAAAAEVDQEIAQGWLGPVVDPLTKDSRIQELYEQRLDEARQGLDQGLQIRQTSGAPHTLWANASHEQMNTAISQNANSATVAESSEEWVRVGNELAVHQQNLADAISASSGDWQGKGGDAAREHLAKVGQWLGSTAKGSALTGRQQQIHSQTLNETQKQMAANPPVQFSVQEANARLQQIKDPIQYAAAADQAMQTYRAQQAARDHAAVIMTQFDDTIGSAIATPAFPSPPKLPGARSAAGGGSGGGGASGGGSDAAQPFAARNLPSGQVEVPSLANASADLPAGQGNGQGAPPAFAPGEGPGGSGNFSGSGGPSGSGGQNAPAAYNPPPLNVPDLPSGGGSGGGSYNPSMPPAPHFDDTTKSAGYSPPPAASYTPPPLNVPDLPDSSPSGRPGTPGFTPPAFTPGTSTGLGGTGLGGTKVPGLGALGGVNGESISSRLSGLGGGGSGSGSGGLGSSGLGGGGAAGGASNLRGAGNLSAGAGVGAAAEAEAAAARNAAAGAAGAKPGTAGAPGAGGMGAGRGGKKEDDAEHRLADYLEIDDPDTFAAEEAVAPPVIGDWKNKDWK